MSLRDAQEDVRIVYAARRDFAKGSETENLLLSHIAQAVDILKSLQKGERKAYEQDSASKTRMIGLLLLVTLELANEMEVDSLEALKTMLLEVSP